MLNNASMLPSSPARSIAPSISCGRRRSPYRTRTYSQAKLGDFWWDKCAGCDSAEADRGVHGAVNIERDGTGDVRWDR